MANPIEVASDLEVMVYDWLSTRKINFNFQSQMIGGFVRSLGDAIVDFNLIDLNILLRVMGEYFHSSIEEVARDKIQKVNLIAMGYMVVDVWGNDLKVNIDYVMEHALKGEEVTLTGAPISAVNSYRRYSGGFATGALQTYTMPDVRTDLPSGDTAQGTLVDDGAAPCQTKFEYNEAEEDLSLLCYIFPWKFFSLINRLTPNVPLTFATYPSTYPFVTDWQTGKVTGDSLTGTMAGLIGGKWYSVRAVAANKKYQDTGNDLLFYKV